ncbi:MAG: alanyl-tRNA editing protein [Methanomassiliicoccales archaeon]
MTVPLYRKDPYLKSFEASVAAVEGDWVSLDRTAFFPGGGGQDPDRGWIGGLEVAEVREDEGIWHRIPGHHLSPGDRVQGELDWDHRYGLMRAHTAEHLLFHSLKERGEVELCKIVISERSSSVVVQGEVDWEMLHRAQAEVNRMISSSLPVTATWLDRSDPGLEGVRAKLERVTDDRIRVVDIGDLDQAACSGIHVSDTKEIGRLLITGFTTARNGDYEIHFMVGEEAVDRGLELASIALQASSSAGAHPEDLVSALENMRGELRRTKKALERYGRRVLRELDPEEIGGIHVYHGHYPGVDKRTLISAANRFVERWGSMAVLTGGEEKLMMIVARGEDLDVDCREVLSRSLSPLGGRGGGKPSFASGGAQEMDRGEEALEGALEYLRRVDR